MVFFSCSNCGETMKKKAVETHYFRCRPEGFSCLDCHKDFWGTSYAQHTECITENERYGGKDYIPKVLTGKLKQQAWVQRVRDAVRNTHFKNPDVRRILEKTVTLDSVPKKEAKFINYLKSSYRTPEAVGKEAWNFLEQVKTQEMKEKEEMKQQEQKASQQPTNGHSKSEPSSDTHTTPKTEKTNDGETKENEKSETNGSGNNEFKWKTTIRRCLKKAPPSGIKLKKLQKKVIECYKASGQSALDVNKLEEIFQTKLSHNKFIVDGAFVRLKDTS